MSFLISRNRNNSLPPKILTPGEFEESRKTILTRADVLKMHCKELLEHLDESGDATLATISRNVKKMPDEYVADAITLDYISDKRADIESIAAIINTTVVRIKSMQKVNYSLYECTELEKIKNVLATVEKRISDTVTQIRLLVEHLLKIHSVSVKGEKE